MARLEFSATRLDGREINLRNDRLPVKYSHPVRDIDDCMDDIVYNAIDLIQERADDNELRIHYFNKMSDDDYRNADFKKLVLLIADVVDIGMASNKFRDTRDAVIAVTEDVVKLHIGYMTEEYPDLMRYVARGGERDIDRAVNTFEKYLDAVDVYRRNGNRLVSDRGGRGRDRGRDRDRDDRDDDRGGRSSRRDQWNRGAVRDGIHGSRAASNRQNRFGNTDQSDRFDNTVTSTDPVNERDQRDDRRNADDRRRNDRQDDRFDNSVTGHVRNTRNETKDPVDLVSIQRLPGSRKDPDVEDALARKEESENPMNNVHDVALVNPKNPLINAAAEQEAWIPTKAYPHPLAMNHTQNLYYEMELASGNVIPHLVKKDPIVDYHAHASLAFGETPRDFRRFENGGVSSRLNNLHEALLAPSQEITPEGADEPITIHRRIDVEDVLVCFSLKEMLTNLSYRRFAVQQKQQNDVAISPVELAVGSGVLVETFMATQEEYDLISELREEKSFVKLCEKLRMASKKVRPELFLLLDQYLTKAINRIMRQYLSIPVLAISSFTSDWLELFSLISTKYGEAYRDAIVQHQEKEIKQLLNYSPIAENAVMMKNEEVPGLRPFVIGVTTKVFYINEVGYNLDLDMMPNIASDLLPETNPFFHDLAQDLLAKGSEFSRYYIQTADMRVIEASRSYINDRAVLVRMVQ